MPPFSRTAVLPLIRQALHEDAAHRDVTSHAVIPSNARIRARGIAKSRGVAAGVKTAVLTFTTLDPSLRCRIRRHSGQRVAPGATIFTIEGRARSIFAAERVALNFLGHLSGIATLTDQFVRRVKGTNAKILDTRKTTPGLRLLEKYAVLAGGGHSHRRDLSDAVLIKTNHLKALRSISREAYLVKRQRAKTNVIQEAIRLARRRHPHKFLEVEVRNLQECRAALLARPNAVLLDNWSLGAIRRAVLLRDTLHASPARREPVAGRARFTALEVSGGVTLANVRAIAKTDVDRISIGRLTHSAPSLDVSLQVA